jgi:SEC-C motif-containing protein
LPTSKAASLRGRQRVGKSASRKAKPKISQVSITSSVTSMTATQKESPCPCGGGAYTQCCGRFISGEKVPQTALELMRSRYTAYTMQDDAYLQSTWHCSTRPVEEKITEAGLKWLGLEVRKHVPAGDEATVEFIARYKVGGRAHRLHEISRFVREDGRWFYVDGSFPEKAQK